MGRFLFTASHFRRAAFMLALIMLLGAAAILGQSVDSQSGHAGAATLQGSVRDSNGRPVANATVCLQARSTPAKDAQPVIVRTDSAGAYRFSAIRSDTYNLSAEMTGYATATSDSITLKENESKTIDLTLELTKTADRQSLTALPQFFDEPHFTVAGVTDTTTLGGHGSDAIVRNREALVQATVSLGELSPRNSPPVSNNPAAERSLRESVEHDPKSFGPNYQLGALLVAEGKAREALPYLERASGVNPHDYDSAYELALARADSGDYQRARQDIQALLAEQSKSGQEKAKAHHLLAEVDEKLGSPLDAVKEFQRAAELNPSESNLFDWASELLEHRAVEPAFEVFAKGNRLFPRSVRMLAGLGASWYARGSYENAAQRLCEASDLDPNDPYPYLLMGKMQAAETTQSEAIVERLRRFVRLQPQNALANYYYAVSLWKARKSPDDISDLAQIKLLLEKAVQLDPKLGPGYLQLGILYAEQRDFPRAIAAYRQAIAATPQLEEAHYRLAQLYRQTGETANAQAELQLYTQVSKERADETERQRRQVQQFVFQLGDQTSTPKP
ncbi:MAG: tetratricopeptide repeat protein [Candidatus Sulfotelmatobacter sp.]